MKTQKFELMGWKRMYVAGMNRRPNPVIEVKLEAGKRSAAEESKLNAIQQKAFRMNFLSGPQGILDPRLF